MRRPAHFKQRSVSQPVMLPNDAANEEMSESEGLPFMPTSFESEYQTESSGKINPENTANDYQDLSEQNMPFIPMTFEHISSQGITDSDHMPFDPAFQESEYQPQDNIGYDYQELQDLSNRELPVACQIYACNLWKSDAAANKEMPQIDWGPMPPVPASLESEYQTETHLESNGVNNGGDIQQGFDFPKRVTHHNK